jgi:FKBP-type peptidyl-prolyl cis-trans isomerase FkpA
MIVPTLWNSRSGFRPAARVLVALLAIVALTSCLNLNVDNPSSEPSDPATETFAPALHIDISTMQRTPSGVYYKDGPLGSGAAFTGLGALVVSYVGYLKNGIVFQQGNNAQIRLSNEIVGLQEGLQGMRAGGERLLVIPSALAFGASAGAVPPNSTVIYDIIVDAIP